MECLPITSPDCSVFRTQLRVSFIRSVNTIISPRPLSLSTGCHCNSVSSSRYSYMSTRPYMALPLSICLICCCHTIPTAACSLQTRTILPNRDSVWTRVGAVPLCVPLHVYGTLFPKPSRTRAQLTLSRTVLRPICSLKPTSDSYLYMLLCLCLLYMPQSSAQLCGNHGFLI